MSQTVDWHIEQAMKRLDAKNRVQAVVLAMQKSALTIDRLAPAAAVRLKTP